MTSRREAILGRFRARSLDRLRQVEAALLELAQGRGDAATLPGIARELHTLKGDSRVVGLGALAELVHAAEDLLLDPAAAAAPALPLTCRRVQTALLTAASVLREELTGADADAALLRARQALAADAPGGPTAAPAQPAPAAPPTPAPAPAAPRASAAASVKAPADRWLYVRLGRLEEHCERVLDFAVQFRSIAWQLGEAVRTGAPASQVRGLLEAMERGQWKLDDAVSSAWALRLVSVEPALEELVTHARELATAQGKRLRVVVQGHGAELERGVLDALMEPLLHLVRNAVDHGLEGPAERGPKAPEGTLTLEAQALGASLVLRVVDDGRGVAVEEVRAAAVRRGLYSAGEAALLSEAELLELLFHHGFSTRRQATEVSGRGVGLDVVREGVGRLGGTVQLATQSGHGTVFTVTVPSTLTRERALVVSEGGLLYGLPSVTVTEVVRLTPEVQAETVGGAALRLRGELVPLRTLAQLVGAPGQGAPTWVAVLRAGTRRLALALEHLVGERELLRRPVDAMLAPFPHIGASAILDDGRLVLLLSVAELAHRHQLRHRAVAAPARSSAPTQVKVLVVDDSPTVADLVREFLTEAGFEVRLATNGAEALETLAGWTPGLVLSDVDMPTMNGFELLERVRSRWPHLPVVMLTTRGSTEDRRRAASLGASAYLVKSQFDETTLVETVRRLAGGAG